MFRTGIVSQQDAAGCRVRVKFPDRDNLVSWWLPIVAPKSQNDKFYWLPDLGEQVVCLMDEHDENGCVLGSIYSTADRAPVSSADKFHFGFKDGASFEYDRAGHALAISLPAGATLNINCNGATISVDGSGNLSLNTSAEIMLAGGGQPIARKGDATTCPVGAGSITGGSAKVQSG